MDEEHIITLLKENLQEYKNSIKVVTYALSYYTLSLFVLTLVDHAGVFCFRWNFYSFFPRIKK
jgi:hypothetical protein